MAKDDDSISVQVDDLDTVQVQVDGNPVDPAGGQAAVAAPPAAEVEPKTKTTRKRVSPEPDVEAATPSTTPDKALEEAIAQAKRSDEARVAAEATAAAERTRAEQAERDRQRAIKEAEDSAQRAANTELTMIDSSLEAANRELEAQRDAYTRAAEAGEFSKMADIQIKMSKAAAAIDRLEDAKSAFESGARQTATHTAEPQPVASQTERFLSQFAPQAQNWLRMHLDCLPPEQGGNAVKHNKMMQGHYAAIASGTQLNTPDYFRVIEEHVGVRQPVSAAAAVTPATAAPVAAPVEPARAAPAVAAPVSRDAPSASGTPAARNIREVRLTRDQQEMAKVSFPHLPEQQAYGMYARNLLELEAEGKLGRTSH